MDKHKRGSAYIMVVFVSFPILLAALMALAVSINSRNISARHSDFFGMYELASAAVVSSILTFEEAYMAYRQAAHRDALLHFGLVFDDYHVEYDENFRGLYENYGENDDVCEDIADNNEEDEFLPAEYVNRFRHYLVPMIWTHLKRSNVQSGNDLTRQFEIILGTDHVFYGTIRIIREVDRNTREVVGIYFRSTVTKRSDNISPMRASVRGIIRWPAPVERKLYFCEINQIKNLDYFTPWVVELKKYDRHL